MQMLHCAGRLSVFVPFLCVYVVAVALQVFSFLFDESDAGAEICFHSSERIVHPFIVWRGSVVCLSFHYNGLWSRVYPIQTCQVMDEFLCKKLRQKCLYHLILL